MSQNPDREKKDEKSEAQSQEKGVVGRSKGLTCCEGLDDIMCYLLSHYRLTVPAVNSISYEVLDYAKKYYDEVRSFNAQIFYGEVNKVVVLTDLITEIVKTDRDHDYFLTSNGVKKYLEIMTKLATVWKTFETADRLDRDIKIDPLIEMVKAVETELKEVVLRIIDFAYHCNEPEDEEGCCDDEPEESDDDPGYDEEEGEEA
jgi:hypothetical protein